jgi:hypothetical protein
MTDPIDFTNICCGISMLMLGVSLFILALKSHGGK